MAAQRAAAMAAGFAAGHLFFPHHWTWTVITAFVVCSAARSRGDVVHRSGLRIAGAFTGALTGTLVAHPVSGAPAAGVTVTSCYLLIGVWLRDLIRAVWAFRTPRSPSGRSRGRPPYAGTVGAYPSGTRPAHHQEAAPCCAPCSSPRSTGPP
ncbi:FUSC family protein [Actinacidiphila sp. ITFR-21]|uniref:FUSC family protein n=1 Tax=Actinacidiphila sp. ITFR-21 TaxID=3075199 RepID=UPI00288ADC7D|nr:FUSC family protein [Streptomyces sp. ITFR-21]WNI15926.1 FUSC family protein [Streptomyces sp. ITFR-21]